MVELNGYFKKTGKTFVVINGGSEWEGCRPHKVTIKELIRYYYKDARNITSGIRTLGTIVGDWRPIDNLASEILAYFKETNRPALEREGRKYGMELKS